MNVYCIYVIIAPNYNSKKNYIVSSDKNEIVLPIVKINNGKFLHNELRYNIKHMFNSDTINSLIQYIELSYIEIQHELAVNYINSINNNTYTDNDIFLLVGIILDQTYESFLEWKEFSFNNTINSLSVIDHIIDFTIQKTIL